MANRFSERSLKSFDVVFMRDVISEYDIAFKHEHSAFKENRFGIWRRIALFFGLPVSLRQPNLLKNFFGWHSDQSPNWQRYLNYTGVKPLAVVLLHLAMMPFHFVKNTLLLLGVYLPKLVNELSWELFLKIANEEFESYKQKGVSWLTIPAIFISGLLLIGVYLPSLMISLLSEAMLSPLKMLNQFMVKARQNDNAFYKFLGFAFLFAAVVMLTTAMVFGGQLLAPFAFPVIFATLPANVVAGISSVYGSVCIALTKVLPTIAMLFNFMSLGVFKALMVPTGISVLDAGMAVSLSMLSLSLFAVFDSIKDSISQWYHSFEKSKKPLSYYQQEDLSDEEPLLSASTEKLLASFGQAVEIGLEVTNVAEPEASDSAEEKVDLDRSEEYVLESDDESMGFKPAKL